MPIISKTVTINKIDYVVQRVNLIGTKIYVYSAWVELNDHSVRMHDDHGKALGKVGSEPISTVVQVMSTMSKERHHSVHMHYEQQYDAAYIAILQAFGTEAAYGKCSMGEVTVSDI